MDMIILAIIGLIILFVVWYVLAAIKIAREWERMPLLRLGKFKAMKGPGLFFAWPIFDKVPVIVDLRTIPVDVTPQKTLTKDNVPVMVDAVIFYRVQNPTKAVLEVKDYQKAIYLAAPPLLRDVIGKMMLNEVLQHRDQVASTIMKTLESMARPWGINVEHVEIRDISVSPQLEDAISRVAAAERERMARAQLAMAEKEIAKTLVEAAQTYESDPVALELRSMNMLYEMCMEGKATTIFIPTESALQMRSPIGSFGILDKLGKKLPGTTQ